MVFVGAESIKQSMKATRHGGAVVLFVSSCEDPDTKVGIMLDLFYGANFAGPPWCWHMEQHQLRPQIAKIFFLATQHFVMVRSGEVHNSDQVWYSHPTKRLRRSPGKLVTSGT